MELAIGVVMGSAFNALVQSLVNDIMMPCVGLLVGGIDFAHFKILLKQATASSPPLTLNVGLFMQHCVYLLMIALAIFMGIKLAKVCYRGTMGSDTHD